jgi:hypothetical protein
MSTKEPIGLGARLPGDSAPRDKSDHGENGHARGYRRQRHPFFPSLPRW